MGGAACVLLLIVRGIDAAVMENSSSGAWQTCRGVCGGGAYSRVRRKSMVGRLHWAAVG